MFTSGPSYFHSTPLSHMFNLQPITTHRFLKTEHKAESTADWLKVFATTHLLRVGHQREKVAHLTRAQLTQNFKALTQKNRH